MRTTSLIAWQEAKLTLGERQAQVLEHLAIHGPMTGKQLDHYINADAHKRLSELNRMGKIVEVRKDICPVSGKTAIVWGISKEVQQGSLF